MNRNSGRIRMKSRAFSLLLIMGLSVLVSACIPSEKPPPSEEENGVAPAPPATSEAQNAPTPERLVEEWTKLTRNATDLVTTGQHDQLVRALAKASDTALLPLLDMVADDALNPWARVVTVQAIEGYMSSAYLERLTGLIHDSTDATTRSSAVVLLTNIDDPSVEEELRGLLEDKERRVSFSALRGLALLGDADTRKLMITSYDHEETPRNEKAAILAILSESPQADELIFLTKVALDADTPTYSRIPVMESLARHGDESVILDLKNAEEEATTPEEKVLLQELLQSIEGRLGQGMPEVTTKAEVSDQ
jgi:hypothetical protein